MYRSTYAKLCTVQEYQKPKQKSRKIREDKHKKEKRNKDKKQEEKKKKKKLFAVFLLITAPLKIKTSILSSTVLEDVRIRDQLFIFNPVFL
jgi:hypothetical protein